MHIVCRLNSSDKKIEWNGKITIQMDQEFQTEMKIQRVKPRTQKKKLKAKSC